MNECKKLKEFYYLMNKCFNLCSTKKKQKTNKHESTQSNHQLQTPNEEKIKQNIDRIIV